MLAVSSTSVAPHKWRVKRCYQLSAAVFLLRRHERSAC